MGLETARGLGRKVGQVAMERNSLQYSNPAMPTLSILKRENFGSDCEGPVKVHSDF